MKRVILAMFLLVAIMSGCDFLQGKQDGTDNRDTEDRELEKQKVRDNIAGYVVFEEGFNGNYNLINNSDYTIDEVVVEYEVVCEYIENYQFKSRIENRRKSVTYIKANSRVVGILNVGYSDKLRGRPRIVKIRSAALSL